MRTRRSGKFSGENTTKGKGWYLPTGDGVRDIIQKQESWLWASENTFLVQSYQLCSKCCSLVYKHNGFCGYKGPGPWHGCSRVGSKMSPQDCAAAAPVEWILVAEVTLELNIAGAPVHRTSSEPRRGCPSWCRLLRLCLYRCCFQTQTLLPSPPFSSLWLLFLFLFLLQHSNFCPSLPLIL